MKGIAITHRGTEEIAFLEIKELINAKTEIKESLVIFDFSDFEELCILCYKTQSVKKVLYLLGSFKINDLFKQIKEKLTQIDYKKWFDKKTSFRVSCEHIDNDLNHEEIVKDVGALIINNIKTKQRFSPKVNLDDPDVVFYLYIYKDFCYIGTDISGRDLSKRDYRIFSSRNSIKGTIAYALLRFGNYKVGEILLDPFCRSGEIVIEAGLYASDFPVNYYYKENFAFYKLKPFLKLNIKKLLEEQDRKILKSNSKIYGYDFNQKYIMQAKRNAKIAGIQKIVTITRQDIEWVDLKQKEKNVDKIITYPPQPSKIVGEKKIAKIYQEFFYQAEYILKDNGLVVVLSKSLKLLEEQAKKYKFILKDKKEIWMGQQRMYVGIFVKS